MVLLLLLLSEVRGVWIIFNVYTCGFAMLLLGTCLLIRNALVAAERSMFIRRSPEKVPDDENAHLSLI